MIDLAISMPGEFYRDAITRALERSGNFRVTALAERYGGRGLGSDTAKTSGGPGNMGNGKSGGGGPGGAAGPPDPEVALLGISVAKGYTLGERKKVIERIRHELPECKILLFLDEEVSPEQTEGVKQYRQAKLIDGFLYASGTMEYLVATLESL